MISAFVLLLALNLKWRGREEEKIMKCPRCGKEVSEGSKFCTGCGLPLGNAGDAGRRKHNRNLVILVVVILSAAVVAAAFGIRYLQERKGPGERGSLSLSDLEDWEELPEDLWTPDLEEPEETPSPSPSASPMPTRTSTPTPTPTPAPTYDPQEGGVHRYEFVVADCTWQEAFQAAKEKGGYLARINSREEYQAILSEISSRGLADIHFRIGGRREADSQDYYWADEKNQLYGEKINSPTYWCSTEWMAGEPSFQDGTTQEDCLDICYIKSEGKWYFNDVPNDILATVPYYSGRLGYIVEYED